MRDNLAACDSLPAGPDRAVCASKHLESTWGAAADRSAHRTAWDRFADHFSLGAGPDTAGVAPIAVSLAVLALAAWLAIAAETYVPPLPEGRDPEGPAAGLRRTRIAQRRLVAGWVAVVGLAALAATAVIVWLVIPAALLAWWLVRRRPTLAVAAAGFAAAEAAYLSQLKAARAAAAAASVPSAAAAPHSDIIPTAAAPSGRQTQVPQVRVPEQAMTAKAAVRHARLGGVELVPGSAAANLFTADGGHRPAVKAWFEACKSVNAGSTSEHGFTPCADLVRVIAHPDGDATLVVRPASVQVSVGDLGKPMAVFLRLTACRRHADWHRDHTTNQHTMLISNRDAAASAPAAAKRPAVAPAVDDDGWS